jgi:murein L,D-transpeptidase YcbB/YkuD
MLVLSGNSYSQIQYAIQDTAYIHAVEQGLKYLKKGECQSCLNAYQKAFKISQKSSLSMMRAAFCAYQCQQEQVAKNYIQQIVNTDYESAEHAWEDKEVSPELDIARSSNMGTYIQTVFDQKNAQLGLNQSLRKQLIAIHTSDQQPRLHVDSVQRIYGQNSSQMHKLWQQIHRSDSLNLVKIEQIIHEYGYPGKSLVGSREMSTAWLIIQHSPLSIQEKYLPLIKKAAKEGEVEKSNLALLIDRIRMNKGQKQLYGSQVTTDSRGHLSFHPIEDEINVNKRRQESGMESIEEYAKQFGITYQ